MRPFFAVASQFRRQVASPRSSAACSFSYTVTGMPAFAKLIAMPPPIVPKPMMAAVRIGRVGVSSGTSGIFAAARSAKNAWRSAFDSGDCTSSMKSPRSKPRPSSNGFVTAASTASTHFSGAGSPRACFATSRARGGEHRRGIGARRQRHLAVAQLRMRRARRHLLREGQHAVERTAIDDPLHQPALQRVVGPDRVAAS